MTKRTRSGFTLIELLVVIAIIATLMGLLIPSVMFVQNKAKKTKTRSFLSQVEAALKTFKDVNGVYPEIGMDIVTTGTNPVQNDAAATNWTQNATALFTALKTVDRETFINGPTLLDPYLQPVHYRPAKAYPFKATGVQYVGHVDSDEPPNADSYQLWSVGGNATDNVATSPGKDEYGDDIVTWK